MEVWSIKDLSIGHYYTIMDWYKQAQDFTSSLQNGLLSFTKFYRDQENYHHALLYRLYKVPVTIGINWNFELISKIAMKIGSSENDLLQD